jgi:preprotein translocase subunit SecG
MSFETALNLAQILISAVLTVIILMQVKGSGFGAALGGQESVYRTRRGVERTLFRLTIVLVIVFIGISLLSVTAVG